jgi:hypothetical protein
MVSLVAQLWLLPDIVLEVQEGNLLSSIDSLVDSVNDQVNALVIVFDAASAEMFRFRISA